MGMLKGHIQHEERLVFFIWFHFEKIRTGFSVKLMLCEMI